MQDIFLIVSVIDVKESPLSYNETRSIYTKEERLTQTLETILSIKNNVPNSKIFMFEAGQSDYKNIFFNKVDGYFYLGKDYIIKKSVNSKLKGLGEVFIIYKSIKLLKKKKLIDHCRLLFKISGRYYINSDFKLSDWNSDKLNFLKINNNYSTRLYAIPKSNLNYYKVISFIAIPFLIIGLSIENIFYKLINVKKVNTIKVLGLSGKVAVDGTEIKE